MGLTDSIEIRPDALQTLMAYSWPGNVRELQNVIARSLILAENGYIDVTDLPHGVRSSLDNATDELIDGQDNLKQQLRNYEKALIKSAISKADGDRKVAADRLGIGVSSLYRKLDEKVRIDN